MDVLPRDIIALPRVCGKEILEYLDVASTEKSGNAGDHDPFAEAAQMIDPNAWYTTSFDATPALSVMRWLPEEGSGLATVSICSQVSGTTVLITYRNRRTARRRR